MHLMLGSPMIAVVWLFCVRISCGAGGDGDGLYRMPHSAKTCVMNNNTYILCAHNANGIIGFPVARTMQVSNVVVFGHCSRRVCGVSDEINLCQRLLPRELDAVNAASLEMSGYRALARLEKRSRWMYKRVLSFNYAWGSAGGMLFVGNGAPARISLNSSDDQSSAVMSWASLARRMFRDTGDHMIGHVPFQGHGHTLGFKGTECLVTPADASAADMMPLVPERLHATPFALETIKRLLRLTRSILRHVWRGDTGTGAQVGRRHMNDDGLPLSVPNQLLWMLHRVAARISQFSTEMEEMVTSGYICSSTLGFRISGVFSHGLPCRDLARVYASLQQYLLTLGDKFSLHSTSSPGGVKIRGEISDSIAAASIGLAKRLAQTTDGLSWYIFAVWTAAQTFETGKRRSKGQVPPVRFMRYRWDLCCSRQEVLLGLLTEMQAEVQDRLLRYVEVGTYNGCTTLFLLERVPRLHATVIDPFELVVPDAQERAEIRKQREAVASRFAAYGNRVEFMQVASPEAADLISDGSLDLVFLDGSHNYETVSAELIAWPAKLRPGGIVAGHDYDRTHMGVVDAVHMAGFQSVEFAADSTFFVRLP